MSDEKRYEGPPATPENFTKAFPEFEGAATRQSAAAAATGGIPYALPRAKPLRPLDEISQRNLDELKHQMRSNPPRAATVINLHPWPLMFPSTDVFLRGIVVPACNPGMEFAYHHI